MSGLTGWPALLRRAAPLRWQGGAGAASGAASALARFQAENGVQDVDADAIYAYNRTEQVRDTHAAAQRRRNVPALCAALHLCCAMLFSC